MYGYRYFINPTQFNNQNDLNNYPNDLKKDLNLIKSISEKINVFSPSIDEMYGDELRQHKTIILMVLIQN